MPPEVTLFASTFGICGSLGVNALRNLLDFAKLPVAGAAHPFRVWLPLGMGAVKLRCRGIHLGIDLLLRVCCL